MNSTQQKENWILNLLTMALIVYLLFSSAKYGADFF